MFSGKKFRLWSRQPPAAKKDTDREQQTRTKNRSGQQTKTDSENLTTITSIVSPPLYHDSTQTTQVIQKLREDNSRLEEIIKDLTPYKIQALALEKKLIATTKAFEKKEVKYTASISSLEYENEQLKEEIKRCRFVCSGCYFCSRQQQQQQQHQFQYNQEPLSAKLFVSPPPPPPLSTKDFPTRNDDGSNDSMQSGESWRRLERLEETQSAIFKETSRQKQETSRCLQQITNELVKALTSQKSLRQDCTQMQDRIRHLEKQNERLNKVIFRQYTPSSSTSSSLQTRHPTVKRNEQPVVIARSDVGQTIFWSDIPSKNICSTDVNIDKGNNHTPAQETFSSPYATPHRTRFSRETHRGAPENCASSDNHIPKEIVRDIATSTAIDNINMPTTRGVGDSVPSKRLDVGRSSSREIEPGTGRNLDWKYENDNRDACHWEASTSSVSVATLQDETEEARRCNETRQNRGSNYSLNDILDGDIDELRLSIENLESTREEKRRSSRNFQCSVNEVFEEPVQMLGQAQSGRDSSVERRTRHSYPGSPLVKSEPTPEKQLLLSEAVDVDDAVENTQNCENTAVLLQKQLDSAIQKIENVINNGSTNKIRRNNDASSDVECQNLHEDHIVTDTNTEDVTSDEDLVWNSLGKDRRVGDFRQEEEEEENEERALLQSDSQTDVSESDHNDEISALVGDDNTSEEDRFVSELNALKPQTSQQERDRTSVSQGFQTECPHPDNSTNEEEKQCIKLTDCQATMEEKLFGKSDRKLDRRTSESEKITAKSEDKISIRRHSLTNDNLSNDKKKEIAMSKDMVTALTAYFEEVHAEHCSGYQHSTPKSRTSSFASRSSSDSKGSSSFDDNDSGNAFSGIHDHTDEFRTIRHQRSPAKTAEETAAHREEQIHESVSEKSLMEDHSSVETQATRTKPSESELVIGSGCVQPSQSTELDHRPADSTPDSVTPVNLQTEIAVPQGKSQHYETSSLLQEHLEQAPQGSGALQNLQEEDGKMPLDEIINTSTMVTDCDFDNQTLCQNLSSTGERASPLHVNYVRTCSLKSFWDVVTPPSSPRVEKLDEGKVFPDIPDHGNTIDDNTDMAQIHGSSDSKDDCAQSKGHGEEPLEKEITPVSAEFREDHSQIYSPLPLLRQPSSAVADTNKVCGDLEDDRWYGIPLKDHVLFKCEFPESQEQPEALRHEFDESSTDGKTHDSRGSNAEHPLDCTKSDTTEPSGIDEEQRDIVASSGGTLTEKDIRKYRLGCHVYGGPQQGCLDDNGKIDSETDATGEDHLWLPMEQITEMDFSENQRGLSSKPPLPPKRYHSMQHYARDNGNLDQEIPDYEELYEDNDDFSYNSDKKRYHGTESSPCDNSRNATLDSERYVFHYPKGETHIPVSTSASTGFQSVFQKNPVQFRTYSKSWESGKRNSYPAARFRSYSQPEEQWDNVASTDSAWRYPVDSERNVRPLSAYQVLNAPSRGFSTDVPSRVGLAVRQQRQHRQENQKSKDAENDLVFHEITKQIESLQQTVSELQSREANSNSIF